MNLIYSQIQSKTQEENKNIVIENNPLISLEPSDYLEKHIASKKISLLKEQAEKNLRKLGRIIKYFESQLQDSKKKYEEATNLYKLGIESYYSGDILKSYQYFQKCKTLSNQLLFDYSKIYKSKSTELSSQIAIKISELEKDSLNAPHFLIYDTTHRLTVMKNKINTAEELIRFNQYGEAIDLYRNAKILGIISLYQLEQDKAKKEEILKQYQIDLEDANYNPENIKLESF